jgi:hypothetical protein
MRELISKAGWLLSPSRKIIDRWKQGDRAHRGKILRRWSLGLFYAETLGSVALALVVTHPPPAGPSATAIAVVIYAYSRINEIAFAFYRDPLSRAKESDLANNDRIRMAMRSYFGLAFNFALLYYFVPIAGMFKEPLCSFFEAFYFSGVTLATLGYGDVLAVHWVSRLLALYEVFAGILLIAVAIATYVGGVGENDA